MLQSQSFCFISSNLTCNCFAVIQLTLNSTWLKNFNRISVRMRGLNLWSSIQIMLTPVQHFYDIKVKQKCIWKEKSTKMRQYENTLAVCICLNVHVTCNVNEGPSRVYQHYIEWCQVLCISHPCSNSRDIGREPNQTYIISVGVCCVWVRADTGTVREQFSETKTYLTPCKLNPCNHI